MNTSAHLVAVLVTDKNGRTVTRRKRPENIKPSDILVEVTLKNEVVAPPIISKPTDAEIIANSSISYEILESVLSNIPVSNIVNSKAQGARVNVLVSDIFGYESELCLDFTNNVTVHKDKLVLDFQRQPAYYIENTRATARDKKALPLVRGWKAMASN